MQYLSFRTMVSVPWYQYHALSEPRYHGLSIKLYLSVSEPQYHGLSIKLYLSVSEPQYHGLSIKLYLSVSEPQYLHGNACSVCSEGRSLAWLPEQP